MSWLDRLRHRLIDGPPGGRPGRAVEFGKTMLIVVPLTVLIWIYAERAQTGPGKVSLLLVAATAEPNLIADVVEPVREPLTIDLFGPRGQIEELKRKIEQKLEDGRYRLTLSGVDAAVGPHVIDATQLLNRDPLINSSGVTVTGTTPAQIRVAVDTLVSRPATVTLQRDNLKVQLINQSFEPATVTLTGPQSAFPPGETIVWADPSGLTASEEVGAQTIDVPLIPPTDSRLKLSTTKVKMTYTAGSSVSFDTVPTAFIDIVRPAGDSDGRTKVILTSGNVVHNVQLRGPTNLVNKYTGATPTATLRLMLPVKHEDIGQPSLRRKLEWMPIEGGQVKIEGEYEVTFEVRED